MSYRNKLFQEYQKDDTGLDSTFPEWVITHCQALTKRVEELEDILSSFDWEIKGNHVLTGTCTRLTDSQIKLLSPKGGGE